MKLFEESFLPLLKATTSKARATIEEKHWKKWVSKPKELLTDFSSSLFPLTQYLIVVRRSWKNNKC